MENIRYSRLIEQSAAFKTLLKDCAPQRLSHAYLLLSPDKSALDALTDMFLFRLIACSYSAARAAAVAEHTLSDVIRLPEEGAKVTVKDINYLTETAFITPTELNVKFYVIDYGETMNEACQNKLLKTLEEPPEVTCIIIKAASDAKILPTVASRCRKVELMPFTLPALRAELVKYYPDDDKLKLALSACRGSLTRAENILADASYLKAFSLASSVLTDLDKSGGAAEFAFKLYDYRDCLRDIIDFMELLLRDAAAYQCGGAVQSAASDIETISKRYPINVALKEMPVLERARKRLELNGNVTSVIDELLFSLLEVRAKWK